MRDSWSRNFGYEETNEVTVEWIVGKANNVALEMDSFTESEDRFVVRRLPSS